jgi:hypothetical protein
MDAHDRPSAYNPEAPLPFDSKTFGHVVDALRFHKACLSSLPNMSPEFGQVSKISGPNGVICKFQSKPVSYISDKGTALYVESYSYRNRWHKLSLSYAPKTMTSSIFLHNLPVGDSRALISKLHRPAIQPLTIHPMLIPVLVFEFSCDHCLRELNRLFVRCVEMYQSFGLSNRSFSRFRDTEADDRVAAQLAFGDGQDLSALEERMDVSIMMAKRLLSYFEDFEQKTPDGPLKSPFIEAGSIIRTRLEYFLDLLEFQLPRLRRAKSHTVLNRTGVCPFAPFSLSTNALRSSKTAQLPKATKSNIKLL